MTFHGHGFLRLALPSDAVPLTGDVYSGFGFRSSQDSALLFQRESPVRLPHLQGSFAYPCNALTQPQIWGFQYFLPVKRLCLVYTTHSLDLSLPAGTEPMLLGTRPVSLAIGSTLGTRPVSLSFVSTPAPLMVPSTVGTEPVHL